MDGARFDRLTAAWARRRSRRGVLAVLGSGALATSLGLARPAPVEARCRRGENCNRDRFKDCPEDIDCAKVKNVDGGPCACIERECGAPCSTGSDCDSGLCVKVPGCCETDKFCGTPCGAVTATGEARTTSGWQKK
jgi:hypothetical protein